LSRGSFLRLGNELRAGRRAGWFANHLERILQSCGCWGSERERRRRHDAILADRTRGLLRVSLARHIPGAVVWVYGSLVKPGRFHEWSDVDVALESLPAGMTLEYLQSLLSADVGRQVDVCLIDRTRLKPVIEGSGERWIA
jgi:predicted nucleotidyltransferase